MEENRWIIFFEQIDINKPPLINIKVTKGEIVEAFVKENYNVCIQLMHELKKKIGFSKRQLKWN